jgi:hypothetical protein
MNYDSSYEIIQKSTPWRIQYFLQIKLYDMIVYHVFNIYISTFHLNNIFKQIVVPTNF